MHQTCREWGADSKKEGLGEGSRMGREGAEMAICCVYHLGKLLKAMTKILKEVEKIHNQIKANGKIHR